MDVRIFIVSVVAEQTFLFLLFISLQWQFMVQMYVSTCFVSTCFICLKRREVKEFSWRLCLLLCLQWWAASHHIFVPSSIYCYYLVCLHHLCFYWVCQVKVLGGHWECVREKALRILSSSTLVKSDNCKCNTIREIADLIDSVVRSSA
jgi:hypothetical protein